MSTELENLKAELAELAGRIAALETAEQPEAEWPKVVDTYFYGVAGVLQELVDAPEAEPVLVVETEPGYWNRGHYCEGTKSYIDPTKVWGLPVGTKLYTAPPAPSVPETEPVARVTGYYGGYLSIVTVDGRVLPAGTALYAAPPHQSEHHLEMVNTPAPSVPDGWKLVPVEPTPEMMRSGMSVPFNKAARHNAVYRAMLAAAPTPAAPPADLDAPEFSDGCEKEGFPGGCARMGCCKQLPATANPARTGSSQIEPPADLVQDSVASEPVGYLYTNLQSGEYHVSDADDDYRGPERVLWCIEPVYRRAKGKQA